MKHYFKRKSLASIFSEINNKDSNLKPTLGIWHIIALGVGAIIGAGLFIRTASAAAMGAGPGVVISFILAGIGCALTGLCYAELAAMIPSSGSAYTYTYIAMGEMAAWIIGWALVQEYAIGSSMVSIAWSEYINNFLKVNFHFEIPYAWIHSPFEHLVQHANSQGHMVTTSMSLWKTLPEGAVILKNGIMNLPAILILFLITLLLIKGTQESALVNSIMVIVKIAIVLLFIIIGWQFINPMNHDPFLIPKGITPNHESFFHYGWGGVMFGAAYVFFAFIGFDAVSTAAQEAKNPQRDMPRGILGSLFLCTLLYVLFSYVLTGVANYKEFLDSGKEASVSYVIQTYMQQYGWLDRFVTVAIIVGFTTVILMMLFGQSRVLLNMARDGLLPKTFTKIHPRFKTPYICSLIVFAFAGLLGGILPIELAGDLSSFGTLFAFSAVCIALIIMRKTNPEVKRPFKTPLVPVVPILGAVICIGMIVVLDALTLTVASIWMLLGLVIFFIRKAFFSKG